MLWNNITDKLPPDGVLVDVIYSDGLQCRAKLCGRMFFPEGSECYRYVNVIMWRPI